MKNEVDYQLLDKLIDRSRWHYGYSMGCSIALIYVSAQHNPQYVNIPIFDFSLRTYTFTVFMYISCVVFLTMSDLYYRRARKWLFIDSRKLPYSWIVLNGSSKGRRSFLLWILPLIISSIAFVGCVGLNPLSTISLIFFGLLVMFAPEICDDYYKLVKTRRDKNGNCATLSVWLDNLNHMEGAVSFPAMLVAMLFATINEWKKPFTIVALALIVWNAFSYLAGLILSFVTKWINHIGTIWGFPESNEPKTQP